MVLLNPYTHDTRVEKEAATLRDAGYAVTVVAEAAPGSPEAEVRDGIHIRRVRRPPGPPIVRYFRFRRALGARLAESRPDVLHAHDTETLQLAALTARRLRVPFVYDGHDLWLGRLRRSRSRLFWAGYRAFYWLIERSYLPRAAAWLTVSDPIARHLERVYRLPRVDVVGNFPEVSGAPVQRDLRSLPGAEGIPATAPIVLYIGHVMSGRGVAELITAMAQVPDAHLVLLGGAGRAPWVRSVAQAAGVGDRVHALRPVPAAEISDYAASASVAVSPILPVCLNYRYSLPNKLFQSMAGGIPVVASDFPQVRVAVEETGAGLVVDPRDPARIAAALRTILSDPALARRMGAAARRAVEERYNWGVAANALRDVYARVRPAGSLE